MRDDKIAGNMIRIGQHKNVCYITEIKKKITIFRGQFRIVYNLPRTGFGPSWAIIKRL